MPLTDTPKNHVEEGQNVNDHPTTLSELEDYYKERERQLMEKLRKQEAALAAADEKLRQLVENQKTQLDETNEQSAAREQALKEELYRDSLTGAYNRRYYEEVACKAIGPAGIALMDLDDFKICNDTYGHYAGDMALKAAAAAIRSCIRDSDLLIRYGGDEFLLLFPRMTEEIFLAKKKQIQQAVRSIRMSEFADIRLSVSVGGVCGVHPITEAIRKADYLMYLDKAEQQP